MKTYRSRTPTHHEPELLYRLVADIESYPEFVPYCSALSVNERKPIESTTCLDATMFVGFGPVTESFQSRVILNPEKLKIDVYYLSGPFSHLENHWAFYRDAEHTTVIDFSISYELRSRLLATLANQAVDRVFKRMTRAFLKRADELAEK